MVQRGLIGGGQGGEGQHEERIAYFRGGRKITTGKKKQFFKGKPKGKLPFGRGSYKQLAGGERVSEGRQRESPMIGKNALP